MNDRRPPESPVLSADTLLPFSKGLMARALMGTGIAPERAYELARFVEVGLSVDHPDLVAPSDAVYDVAAAVLSEHEDEGAVRRLRRYQRLQEVESPLVLLVGGADRNREVHDHDRGRAPARDQPRHVHGLRPPDDARVLLRGVHAVDPLLELRGRLRGGRA